VLALPGNAHIGTGLALALGAEAVPYELRQFPDRETFLRIDAQVRGRPVIVVCTLFEPDAKLLPLVYVADTLRELGATMVGLVAPYLAYMRQDCRFNAGEAITSISFARLLSGCFDWLVTVDPHLHRWKALSDIYSVPAVHVQAAPLLGSWVRDHVQQPVVVGPDAESEQWVSAVAAAVPCPWLVLHKVRRGDRDVAVSGIDGVDRWVGHTPVLVDDIISTARTLIEALKTWQQPGLRTPLCLAVHGLFAADAWQALHSAGAAQVVTTNTVEHASNAIDVVPLLIEPVRKLLLTPPSRVDAGASP
jgi:ribose-phosphate pyrophosphokinase